MDCALCYMLLRTLRRPSSAGVHGTMNGDNRPQLALNMYAGLAIGPALRLCPRATRDPVLWSLKLAPGIDTHLPTRTGTPRVPNRVNQRATYGPGWHRKLLFMDSAKTVTAGHGSS
jgi:hypothetical protein